MAGKKKSTQSKNSRSSRKVVTSYEKKVRPVKEFVWLEAGSPRQQEVHQLCEIVETKKQFGKTYYKYPNPKLASVSKFEADC